MKLDWKFIANSSLSIVSKGVLIVGGVYLLTLLFLSLFYQPQQVRVTNVTSSSATVSWYTEAPMTGVVVYKEKDSFLPWVLSSVGGRKAYDDRDYARAQRECVENFNKKIESEVDEDFAVSGENYNCDTVSVKRIGRYYVHHVTIRNLNESKEYHFRVGDRLWGWKGEVSSLKTFKTPTSIKEPTPVFGRIVSSDGNYSSDSIVFAKFLNTKAQVSVEYSSVTNEEGGWYLDGGNLMSNTGEVMDVASGNDLFEVTGRYKSSAETLPIKWVFGDFDGAYPDLEIEYKEKDNFLYKLVFGVNAACDPAVTGAGNCIKQCVNGGKSTQYCMEAAGYCDGNAIKCAGNYSAITGTAITANEWTNNGGYTVELDPNTNQWKEKKPNNPPEDEDPAGPATAPVVPTDTGITASISPGGDWTLKFGGSDVTNLSDVISPEQKEKLYSENKCIPSVACEFSVSVFAVNIVTLVQNNPDIGQCILDKKCEVQNLKERVDQQKEELKKVYLQQYGKDFDAALEGWSDLASNYDECSDDIKACRSIEDGVMYTGVVDESWLSSVWEAMTREEKEDFATAYDNVDSSYGPFYDLDKAFIEVDKSGTVFFTNGVYKFRLYLPAEGVVIPNSTYEAYKEPYVIKKDDDRGDATLALDKEKVDEYIEGKMSEEAEKKFFDTYGACINQATCGKALAESMRKELLEKGIEGIYLVEEGSGRVRVVYKPTAADIEAMKKKHEEEINQLELFSDQAPTSSLWKLFDKVVLKSFAQEPESVDQDGFLFFLPEYGMYSLQLGQFEVKKDVSDEKTLYIFYLEVNGKEGFQPPSDPDNPKPYEDVVIKSNSYKIEYVKKSTIRRYDLKKGVNIVSFDFVALSKDGGAYTAKQLITDNKSKKINIEYVSYFEGGRWVDGIKCKDESCFGNDFVILPGRGYLLKSTTNSTISVPSYNLKSAIPLNLSAGWNLIGIHGYKQVYTAKSFIQSVNKVEGLNADNVSWYPTSKGRYEGFQLTDGAEYGFDFPINPMNGYFIRVNEFTPGDDSCKSVIWHEGNDLNGVCGDSKSIF